MPSLRALNDAPCVLNYTGGTKQLALALIMAHTWSHLHYQPYVEGQSLIEIMQPESGQYKFTEHIDLPQEKLSPLEFTNLYFDDVQQDSSPDLLWLDPGQKPLYTERLTQETQRGTPWFSLIQCLEKLFTGNAETHCAWPQDCSTPELKALINRLLQDVTANPPLRHDTDGLHWNPRHPQAKSWKKWIAGQWFEQWVADYLLERQLPHSMLVSNVKLENEASNGADNRENSFLQALKLESNTQIAGQRESDIILAYNQRFLAVECKADIHEGQAVAQWEEQLSSWAKDHGKIQLMIATTPLARIHMGEQRFNAFVRRCLSVRVVLWVVGQNDEAALEYALGELP